jgi:hypothetical protein
MMGADDYYPIFAGKKASWMLVIDIGQARAKLNTPFRDVVFMEAEYLLSVICYHQMLYGIKGLVFY